jgi:hypothetical protein
MGFLLCGLETEALTFCCVAGEFSVPSETSGFRPFDKGKSIFNALPIVHALEDRGIVLWVTSGSPKP